MHIFFQQQAFKKKEVLINLGTFFRAICFFIAALSLLPESIDYKEK
jgi:hypothetical protein